MNDDFIALCIAAVIVGGLLFVAMYLFVYIDYRFMSACAEDVCKYSAEYNVKAAKEILKDHPNARIVL